ncbi:MAG: hypothetical protein P8179_23305 [Candidatus Thiodiazotropha sp.]
MKSLGIEPETVIKSEEWVASVPDDLDDELDEKIETRYEQLLEMNESLVAEQEGENHIHTAGINVTLSDGRVVQASIDPSLVNRLLGVLSADELGVLVSAIADAVENPDQRPLCQR